MLTIASYLIFIIFLIIAVIWTLAAAGLFCAAVVLVLMLASFGLGAGWLKPIFGDEG